MTVGEEIAACSRKIEISREIDGIERYLQVSADMYREITKLRGSLKGPPLTFAELDGSFRS